MKKSFSNMTVFLAFVLALLYFAGCENETSTSVWRPDDEGKPTPVISSIEPASGAVAGVGEVIVKGRNFSTDPGENFVYFINEITNKRGKGTILSATSTEMVLIAADVPGDNLVVKAVVSGAFLDASYSPYVLTPYTKELHTDTLDINSIAVDADENVYVHTESKDIYKITPDGVATLFATTSLKNVPNMKVGPDGLLILTKGTSKVIYQIAEGATKQIKYVSAKGDVDDIEFDTYGGLYSGGRDEELYYNDASGGGRVVADYTGYFIKSVRIYDGYVYVTAVTSLEEGAAVTAGVWRNRITGTDGSVDEKELYFDFSSYMTDETVTIHCANFSAGGDMYVGTSLADPILVVKADGSAETLTPGLILPGAKQIYWGTDGYVYYNRLGNGDDISNAVVRINIQKEGAPYNGRD